MTVGWELGCAPWPQWNTRSITHIHPASPALINLLKTGKKERTHARSLPLSLLTRRLNHACHELLVLRRLPVSSPHHTLRLKAVGVAPPACVILSLRAARSSADPGSEDFSRKKNKKQRREKNLSATTDCVTSPSHPVTPPTRTPPPSSGWTEEVTHTQVVASERRVGKGGGELTLQSGFSCCCPRC